METVERNEVKENFIHDQCANKHLEDNQCFQVKKNTLNLFESAIPLPTGTELVTVAGVDLPKEDAGNALQLLEFCYTFGKEWRVGRSCHLASSCRFSKKLSSYIMSSSCTALFLGSLKASLTS